MSIPPMRGFVRKLLPDRDTHLVFARALTRHPPAAPPQPPDVWVHPLTQSDDPLLPKLNAFCTANAFPDRWPHDMLDAGAHALLALDPATRHIMSMSWLTPRPFLVTEIEHTLDPRSGVYLFGDFVAAPFRGRKLQRLLVQHRLARAAEIPAPFACTIIHQRNAPSIASYSAEGFLPTTALTRSLWLGRKRWSHRAIVRAGANLPSFALTKDAHLRRL